MYEMELATAEAFRDEIKKFAAKDELYKKVLKESPVKVTVYEVKDDDQRRTALIGPHFLQSKKQVFLDKEDVNSLAHEIGHAFLDEGFIGRSAQSPLVRGLTALSPIAALAGGLLSKTPKQQALSAIIPTAMHIPNLATEAAASKKGYELLKDMGASNEELKDYRKEMGKAWLTYAAGPVNTLLNAMVGTAIRSHVLSP